MFSGGNKKETLAFSRRSPITISLMVTKGHTYLIKSAAKGRIFCYHQALRILSSYFLVHTKHISNLNRLFTNIKEKTKPVN